jgi:predicted amidohydrolase YtcJ
MRSFAASLLLALSIVPCAALSSACRPRVEPADVVLTNGRVATVDPARPSAEAIAVRGDRIEAVGTSREIQAYIGDRTEVVDLQGRFAMPGFIDSHAHFGGVGAAKMQLELAPARTWDEIAGMVAEAARKAAPGEWIVGRGWHQEKWHRRPDTTVQGFPTHDLLSRAAPNNPVVLTHASGHATVANAKAMEMAGVTRTTPNPSGGQIVRDGAGVPTGVFQETASGLVTKALAAGRASRTPQQVEADADREVELADEEFLANGVTSVHDAGVSFSEIDRYRRFAERGRLGVRLYVMVDQDEALRPGMLAKYRTIGAANGHVTVRAIKAYMDGALGSRGAWLLEPYADLPASTGLNVQPIPRLAETARVAMDNDYQLCVHAIGDRGNRETLRLYEATVAGRQDKKDIRWRIEHAQHIAAPDIGRFAQLGVIAAMQGIHCTSDAPYVLARLGPERAEAGAYVWQKLLQSGAVVANGTDAPVEDVDPLPGYYALVTRKQKNGQAFYPAQRMSREEALRAYTSSGAHAAFEEGFKGQLKRGYLADITVLSADITTVAEEEIQKARVIYTIVGGQIRYRADGEQKAAKQP